MSDPKLRRLPDREPILGLAQPLMTAAARPTDYLALDPRYDGGCPCATFEVDGTRFRAHCWRVCASCEFAGLHFAGNRRVAERVLVAIGADWCTTEWTLVEHAK